MHVEACAGEGAGNSERDFNVKASHRSSGLVLKLTPFSLDKNLRPPCNIWLRSPEGKAPIIIHSGVKRSAAVMGIYRVQL